MTGEQLQLDGLRAVYRSNVSWVERQRAAAQLISSLHGEVSVDDLRPRADARRDNPRHQNAWGAVFRGKGWRCIGRRKSRYKSNHAREIRVWRWEPEA